MMQFLHSAIKAKGLQFLASLLLLVSHFSVQAQQEWSYTQYQFNLYDINSAYAGNHESVSMSLRHRSQWIGIDGAPSTQAFSLHTPCFGGKFGTGIKLQHEQIGARTQQTAKTSIAYKIHAGAKTVSFGFAAGVLRQAFDKSKIQAQDMEDNQLQSMRASALVPLLDASVFFNTKSFFAGLESGRINRSNFNLNEASIARLYYQLTAVSGYLLRLGREDLIQFSALGRLSEGSIWQAEINLLYLYNNKVWIGGGYRTMSGFTASACAHVTEHFRIGLSYDMATGSMRKGNDGSAEVFIGYNIQNRSDKSIRYF